MKSSEKHPVCSGIQICLGPEKEQQAWLSGDHSALSSTLVNLQTLSHRKQEMVMLLPVHMALGVTQQAVCSG